MSDNSKLLEIPPIPSRSSWQDYVKDLQRPDSRFFDGHFISLGSPVVDKLRVCKVTTAEVVADEIPGHLIEKHLRNNRER